MTLQNLSFRLFKPLNLNSTNPLTGFMEIIPNSSGNMLVSGPVDVSDMEGEVKMMVVSCKTFNDEQVEKAFSLLNEADEDSKPFLKEVIDYFYFWYLESREDFPGEWSLGEEFMHSDDYRTIACRSRVYYPTSQQAIVLRILHEHFEKGTPEISQHSILNTLDEESETSVNRLKDYFRRDLDIWNDLIKKGHRKDTFCLNL